MAVASTVTLGSVTLHAPDSATSAAGPSRWVTGQTVDGTRYSYQTNANAKRLWSLSFRSLTAAQKSALETYFYSTAQGPTNTFTYTHSDGTAYAGARFVDTSLSFERMSSKEWATSFTLETAGVVA